MDRNSHSIYGWKQALLTAPILAPPDFSRMHLDLRSSLMPVVLVELGSIK
jgi:hypothetical protein